MTKTELKTQLDSLGLYFGIDLTKKYPVYYSVLQNQEAGKFKQAIESIIKNTTNVYQNHNFLPDILNFMNPKIDKSNSDKILNELQAKILKYGRYSTPVLTDIQSQIVSDVGGWVNVCNMDQESFKWSLLNLFKDGYELRNEPVKKHIGMYDKPKLQGFKSMKQLSEMNLKGN